MAEATPHFVLFETFGRASSAFAEIVNLEPRQQLQSLLDVPLTNGGRFVLLRAPRAGHGKTHLMSRIQQHFGGSHEFLPIYPVDSTRIDAATSLVDVLRRLTRPLPNNMSGLSTLDVLVRKMFATGFEPLVASGEVPSEDRAAALEALRNRPVDTFDFHHEQAVTAIWTRDHFEMLSSRITLELARRANTPIRETGWWVERLFKFAVTPLNDAARVSKIIQDAQEADPNTVLESLGALLSLLALVVRVVLISDDLEGFAANPAAALKFASYLATLRQCAERVDAIIAINYDVWDNAFIPGLSGGLIDRLLERVIDLRPLGRPEISALLEAHAPGQGERLLERVPIYVTHPRGVLHSASLEPEAKPAEAAKVEHVPSAPAAFEPVPLTSPVPLAPAAQLPEVAQPQVAKPLPKPVLAAEPAAASAPAPVAAETPVVEAKPAAAEKPVSKTLPAVDTAQPEVPVAVAKATELKIDKPAAAKLEPIEPLAPIGTAFKVDHGGRPDAIVIESDAKAESGLPPEAIVLPEKVFATGDDKPAAPAVPKPLSEEIFAEEADPRKPRGQANIVNIGRVHLPDASFLEELKKKAEEAHISVAPKPTAAPKPVVDKTPTAPVPREKTQEELDAEFFALLEGKPLPEPVSDKQPTALTKVQPKPLENDTTPVSLSDLEARMGASAQPAPKKETSTTEVKKDDATSSAPDEVDKVLEDLRKRTGDA